MILKDWEVMQYFREGYLIKQIKEVYYEHKYTIEVYKRINRHKIVYMFEVSGKTKKECRKELNELF